MNAIGMAHKTKVLLVESEPALRKGLVAELEKTGVAAIDAADATEGLALAEDHLPDLIMIDAATLIRDGMDGPALLTKLRKRDWCTRVPILFVDGMSLDDASAWGTPENPTYFYEKEKMDLPALIKEIERQLKEAAIIG